MIPMKKTVSFYPISVSFYLRGILVITMKKTVIPANLSVILSVERHTYRSCQYKCHAIQSLVIM